MHSGVHVPCTAVRYGGVRQKASVLSLLFSVSPCQPHRLRRPQRGSAHSSAGFPLTRANVYQIRHIKKLIVPLGLDCSLSEPVHRIQWSRSRNRGQGRLTHTSMVSGSVHHKQASTWTACGCTELSSCVWYPSVNRESCVKLWAIVLQLLATVWIFLSLSTSPAGKNILIHFCLPLL